MTERLIPICMIVLAGCGSTANDEHVPADGPPPISGGTLYVTNDGLFAIASDPDRASIHVVDLERSAETHRIVLDAEDEPGRIAEDAEGRIHVVMRRSGDVATIDATTGQITARRRACSAPRGIALDPDSHELVVACAEGVIVRMPAQGEEGIRRVRLEPDLRDVVALSGGRLLVSRFRSAEVLWLENDAVVGRARPADTEVPSISGVTRIMTPTVAWNLKLGPVLGGRPTAVLVHQQSQSTQLGVLGVPAAGAQYYGGSCNLGVVRSVVSLVDVEARTFRSAAIDTASLVVDGAAVASSLVVAAAADPGASAEPGTFVPPASGVRVVTMSELGPDVATSCTFSGTDPMLVNEAAIAVAAIPGGGFIAQYRDPAVIRTSRGAEIQLSGGRAHDSGHALFHEAAGTGSTCAGCHPEGGDDGHVWMFDTGMRRTQTMTGGILETAPFHWAGDVPDATAVMAGTFVGRMGGITPRADEVSAFERWVDALVPLAAPASIPDAAERGRAIFEREEMGCITCHNGPRRTNNETVGVNTGGRFQVPALYEIVYRAPYFHDGSAETLEEVVDRHANGAVLTEAERSDLVAYLRSL